MHGGCQDASAVDLDYIPMAAMQLPRYGKREMTSEHLAENLRVKCDDRRSGRPCTSLARHESAQQVESR